MSFWHFLGAGWAKAAPDVKNAAGGWDLADNNSNVSGCWRGRADRAPQAGREQRAKKGGRGGFFFLKLWAKLLGSPVCVCACACVRVFYVY